MQIAERNLVYFSSVSENTHRFVQKLGVPATRIPLHGRIEVDEPYGLVLPTSGGGRATPDINDGVYVPKQVIAFLNNEHNRSLIRGVIAAGNNNFGTEFAYAGNVVSRQCGVPYLYRFELMGTPDDVDAVRSGLADFWKDQTCHQPSQLQSLEPPPPPTRTSMTTTRSMRCSICTTKTARSSSTRTGKPRISTFCSTSTRT